MEEDLAKGEAVFKEDMVNEEGVSISATDCGCRLSTRKLKRVGIVTRKIQWCNVETMDNGKYVTHCGRSNKMTLKEREVCKFKKKGKARICDVFLLSFALFALQTSHSFCGSVGKRDASLI